MIIINNTTAGATNAGVIDMQPGEYLMDVINAINALPENEKPTESNPLTINMYNHSFTVDYDRIAAKVVIPKHVYIHLAGNYSSSNDINEIIPQKAFIGFDFSNASPRSLPMRFLAFAAYVTNQVELEAGIPNGTFDAYLGITLVYAKDTKKYFLVRGTEIIDVTVNLVFYTVDDARLGYFGFVDCQGTSFYSADCKNASFYNADCQGTNFNYADCQGTNFNYADCKYASFNNADCKNANFDNADCKNANFDSSDCKYASFNNADCQDASFGSADCQDASFGSADCQGANFDSADFLDIQLNSQSNFQGANLSGVQNMPTTLNTKAKFIAVVGAINVNAQTIWIDGTSILS